MKESCFLITVDWNPDLVWFTIAESPQNALEKIKPHTKAMGILDRSLRVQDWSNTTLEGLILSNAWQGLEVSDKIKVLVETMKDLTKILSRTTELLDIEVYMQSIEKGLV